jgi:hypothetical protein
MANELGMHPVRCSVALPGDENPENDTLLAWTVVRVRLDATVLEINAPAGVVDSGLLVTPKALVANQSAREETFWVYMMVSTGYEESTLVTLAAGATGAVTFPDWSASPVGTWDVTCWTGLAGDVEPGNDTCRGWVEVGSRHDVGCCYIVAPTGVMDSGTAVLPRAAVANWGLGSELVPVRMRIEPDYFDERVVEVSPGDTVVVAFSEWNAGRVGVAAVRCSTALENDTLTGNDLATDSVWVVNRPDVAVTDLYAPSGQVESGAVVVPLARVCNYSAGPVLVPVRMRIGETYDVLRTKLLVAGGKDTVEFAGWVASPLGWSAVVCSTEVAGDTNHANDLKRDSVLVGAYRDAAVLTIVQPAGVVDSGTTVNPAAIIANFGTSSGVVPVRMRITGGYDSLVHRFVPAGAVDTVEFPSWTASPAGMQSVRCSTELAGDMCVGNDYGDGTVVVGVRRDAACIAVLAPTGIIDSGTTVNPVAVVANYSTSATTVPVLMRIGDGYLKTTHPFLGPGEVDTVSFPEWRAEPYGQVSVTCSTGLAFDERNKNDVVRVDVFVEHVLDAGVTDIIVPVGSVDSGRNVIPKARIVNFGPRREPVPVELRIGGFYRSTRTKTLESGEADTVHFDVWPVTEIGLHMIRCSTMLGRDLNPANDFRDEWVEVNWRDAGCIRIAEPTGVIRAGSIVRPTAWVRNFGSQPTRVPAVFRAGPGYAEVRITDSLAPGDSAELQFPEFTIAPGPLMVSCSTALHLDMHTANDRLMQTVYGADRTVVLEPDSGCEVPAGGTARYALVCTNNGNAADTVDITWYNTRAGWVVELLDSTGTTPLSDHNSNGRPDLGELVPGGSARFVCQLTVPIEEHGRVVDTTEVQATSGTDPSVSDRARLSTRVKVIANVMIEPDQRGSTAPGVTYEHRFSVTNLGNAEDRVDVNLYSAKGSWRRELRDGGGKSLEDQNGNGLPDVGPIPPFGGSIELCLHVRPDAQTKLGEADTTSVRVTSLADETAEDQATAITDVAGSVTALVVEPDIAAALPVGDSAAYQLWVETQGTIEAVVNLAVSASANWQVRLYDEAGTTELKDSDADGMPDLGRVGPATRTFFTVRAAAPEAGILAGNVDSLFCATVRIEASLSGNKGLNDSAVLRLTAVPRFEVHNYANPFQERTRFILSVPSPGRVSLTVYNRLGERLRTLVDNREYPTGIYAVEWDGTNGAGRRLAPGIYLYELELVPNQGLPRRIMKKAILKR